MTTSHKNKAASKKGSEIVQAPPAQSGQRSVGDLALVLGPRTAGCAEWLADMKARIHTAPQRAALAVNMEKLQVHCPPG